MRIAYVSLHWPRTVESGVGKKIIQQIRAWRDEGHEVQFFMHMQEGADKDELIPAISSTFGMYTGFLGFFKTEFERCLAIGRLLPEIRNFHPDVIYLRWGMYVFPAHHLFKIAPVVMEINTNDVIQHGLLGKAFGLYNRLTRGIFLRGVSGLIAASQELADAKEFAAYQKPVCVIANGIEIDPNRSIKAPDNEIPRLAFIGTPGFLWHGVDKLVRLASAFPDLIIDVIGYDILDDSLLPPNNLHLHGYLTRNDYEKILTQVDVGVGTLALHRKGMEEASPLKTRECLAFGIPMVIPYLDSDLQDFTSDCILRIPNSEDNISLHGQEIRDFSYSMRGKRIPMVDLVDRIGMKAKEYKRLAFFQKCQ
jgi:hypothetical protein